MMSRQGCRFGNSAGTGVDQQQMGRLTNEIAAEATNHGMQVRTEVRLGHPAQEIVHTAQQLDTDSSSSATADTPPCSTGSSAASPKRSADTPPAAS
jgi:hypothetical protein